jgi:ferredoxin/flavodoxin
MWYFSSTGNSLYAARTIAEKIGAGTPKPIIESGTDAIETDADCIGFVFPSYLHSVPSIVKNFVSRINLRKKTYVFAVVTHNGEPGGSLRQFGRMVSGKGHILSAGFELKMPGNSIILADLTNDDNERARRLSDAGMRLDVISRMIHKRECTGPVSGDTFRGWFVSSVLKIVLSAYRVHARFWTNGSCVNCGICVRVCPVQNIAISDNKVLWKGKCLNCLACFHWCPRKAVELDTYTSQRLRYTNPSVKIDEMFYR